MTVWNAEGRDTAFAGAARRQVIFWQRYRRENSNGATNARIGSAEDDTQSSVEPTWYPAFGLYGHHKTVAAGASDYLTYAIGVLPASWLDPREPQRPYIYRVRDVVATAWTGITRARCVFLMGSRNSSGANYANSIGFHNNGGPNWYSYLSAMDRSVLRNVDLGRTTSTPRELMFELDGTTKEARWYIDGELRDSFTMGQDNTAPLVLSGYFVELFHAVSGVVADASTNTIYGGLGLGLTIELEETD